MDKTKSLQNKHNANECCYYDDKHKLYYVNATKKAMIPTQCNLNEILKIINTNHQIEIIIIIFNDNNNCLSIINNDTNYDCRIMDGNYEYRYTYDFNFKNTFVTTIRNHNFTKNINDLFEFIKHKIFPIKIYFTIVADIYKYILQIMTNVYLDDDNILLELFFKQVMQIDIDI